MASVAGEVGWSEHMVVSEVLGGIVWRMLDVKALAVVCACS